MNPELIGFTAGLLTSINLIPQIIKSIKTKHVDDLSLGTYVIYNVGLFLWFVYGVMISSPSIIVMDGIGFLSSLLMTYIKVKYNK